MVGGRERGGVVDAEGMHLGHRRCSSSVVDVIGVHRACRGCLSCTLCATDPRTLLPVLRNPARALVLAITSRDCASACFNLLRIIQRPPKRERMRTTGSNVISRSGMLRYQSGLRRVRIHSVGSNKFRFCKLLRAPSSLHSLPLCSNLFIERPIPAIRAVQRGGPVLQLGEDAPVSCKGTLSAVEVRC